MRNLGFKEGFKVQGMIRLLDSEIRVDGLQRFGFIGSRLMNLQDSASRFHSTLPCNKMMATYRHVHICPTDNLRPGVNGLAEGERSWLIAKLTSSMKLRHRVCQWYQIQRRPKPASAQEPPQTSENKAIVTGIVTL